MAPSETHYVRVASFVHRYMPIIPTVLVNGAEGIGTGWSTSIPNYNPRDIVANLRCVPALSFRNVPQQSHGGA